MRPILHATDFSPESVKAMEYAGKLAHLQNTSLIMLHIFDTHVIPNSTIGLGSATKVNDAEADSVQRMKDTFDDLLISWKSDLHVEYQAVSGSSVSRGILQEINNSNPQAVVIGADRSNFSMELITGSTVMSLIKKSSVPIIAIPGHKSHTQFRNIIYATDFLEKDIAALKELIQLTRPFDPAITLLHISDPKHAEESKLSLQWFRELVKEQIPDWPIQYQHVVTEDIHEGLHTMIAEDGYDTLVMLEKERTGLLDELFHQDLINKMEFNLPIPLISFHEKAL